MPFEAAKLWSLITAEGETGPVSVGSSWGSCYCNLGASAFFPERGTGFSPAQVSLEQDHHPRAQPEARRGLLLLWDTSALQAGAKVHCNDLGTKLDRRRPRGELTDQATHLGLV